MLTATTTAPARRTAGRCAHRMRGLAATAARHVAVDLSPQAVEQVAGRVVQLLGNSEQQRRSELISAGELALYLGVARPWVYKHRHLLGGRRIGEGPKAPWRFERRTAMQALERHRAAQRGNGGL